MKFCKTIVVVIIAHGGSYGGSSHTIYDKFNTFQNVKVCLFTTIEVQKFIIKALN